MALKQLWREFYGKPGPNETVEMLKVMLSNQDAMQERVFLAIGKIAEASQKQADVLTQYLKLFQTTGNEVPERWENQPDMLTLEDMVKNGMPKDADEKTQARWVLEHLDKIVN